MGVPPKPGTTSCPSTSRFSNLGGCMKASLSIFCHINCRLLTNNIFYTPNGEAGSSFDSSIFLASTVNASTPLPAQLPGSPIPRAPRLCTVLCCSAVPFDVCDKLSEQPWESRKDLYVLNRCPENLGGTKNSRSGIRMNSVNEPLKQRPQKRR